MPENLLIASSRPSHTAAITKTTTIMSQRERILVSQVRNGTIIVDKESEFFRLLFLGSQSMWLIKNRSDLQN